MKKPAKFEFKHKPGKGYATDLDGDIDNDVLSEKVLKSDIKVVVLAESDFKRLLKAAESGGVELAKLKKLIRKMNKAHQDWCNMGPNVQFPSHEWLEAMGAVIEAAEGK